MHTVTRWYNRLLISIVLIVLMLGLLFVYSASSVYALEHHHCAHYYVIKHALGIMLGCLAGLVVSIIPIKIVRVLSPVCFLSSAILTALTLLPRFAVHVHGSNRWLNLGGLIFQPSELLKVSYILYLAHRLSQKNFRISSLLHGYIPLLAVLGVTSALLLAQPDFGLMITLSLTTFIMLFLAGGRFTHLCTTALLALPACIALVLYKPYRLQRILTFINPWADPQGAGFQIIQSLIAIGSGGWFGVGIGNSKQKFFYLPMQHTDFIFSIIAEETGFIGACCLVGLFITFLYAGIKIASKLSAPFNQYCVLGCVLLISLQAFINLAVTTGIAPTKGMGLPFISYGNTALICSLMMIGLIINAARSDSRIQL